MAKAVNKVFLLGNLGADPEISYLENGTAVTRFSLATSFDVKNKQGEWQETTEWHRIVAWGKIAENINKLLSKGSKVWIMGRLKTQTWKDRETGERKYMTEVHVTEWLPLAKYGNQSQDSSSHAGTMPPPSAPDDVPF